jgi:tetratricopeptide (TPR) repeat protein
VAQAVICAACGAKVKGDRARCPRCREPLVARQQATAAPSNRWATAGIVAGCLAVGGFTIMLVQSSRPGSAAPATRAAASTPAAQTPRAAMRDASETTGIQSSPTAATSGLIAGERAYDSGNLDAALQAFQTAAAANPNDPRALNNLGQVLVRLGRAQDAVPYFDRAVQLEPDSWSYQFNRARAYAQLQQWGPAISGYQRASQLFPGDYATQYNLAKALQASGDLNSAVTAYEKAIALAPGQSEFQLSYGLALEAAARQQDAVAAYRRYLELEPASPEAEKVKAHLAQLESPATAPTVGAGS